MFNVIMISIDSLRPDFIGFYNNNVKDENLTPNIDKFCENAAVFMNVISQGPRTSPSFPAIMSGIYSNIYNDMYNLSEKRILISELLKEAGYTTCAANSNPYLSRATGYNRGFTYYEDFLFSWNKGYLTKKFISFFNKVLSFLKEPYLAANKLNRYVLSTLRAIDEPYFYWIHYMDVHGPYFSRGKWSLISRPKEVFLWRKVTKRPENLSPASINTRYEKINYKEKNILIKNYKIGIKYLDYHIGELLKKLDNDRNVIFMFADHGDMFGEHDCFGHPYKLYEELIKVPLIIKLPKEKLHCNRKVEVNVRLIDMVPTILDILKLNGNHSFDGESLLPLMGGDDDGYHGSFAISEIARKLLAVRKDEWKLILNDIEGTKMLFNLAIDPGEQNNLANKESAKLQKLENILRKHLERIEYNRKNNGETELIANAEIRQRLKSLGYM